MGNCNCGNSRKIARINVVRPQKFGRCKFCVYTTLILSVIGWVAFGLVSRNEGLQLAGYALFVFALLTTLLFSIHLGTIIVRKVKSSTPISSSP